MEKSSIVLALDDKLTKNYVSYKLDNFNSMISDLVTSIKSRSDGKLHITQAREGNIQSRGVIETWIFHELSSTADIINRFNESEIHQMAQEFLLEIVAKGPLTELYYGYEGKQDIFINAHNNIWFVDKNDEEIMTDISFRDHEHLKNFIYRELDEVGKKVDLSNLTVDTKLSDGNRIAVIHESITESIACTIRFLPPELYTFESLQTVDTIDETIKNFFEFCMTEGLSLMIYGETGSGKTSLLGSFMMDTYRKKRRFLTISDTDEHEFRKKHPEANMLQILERNFGSSVFTLIDAIRTALRHRPKKIFFNELRDESIYIYIDALNTGHAGASGVHGGDLEQAENRIISLMQAYNSKFTDSYCYKLFYRAIDVMVHMKSINGKKVVASIDLVDELTENNRVKYKEIFRYQNGSFIHTPYISDKIMKKISIKDNPLTKEEILTNISKGA